MRTPELGSCVISYASNTRSNAHPIDFGTTPITETLPSAKEFVLKVFVEPVNGGRKPTAIPVFEDESLIRLIAVQTVA